MSDATGTADGVAWRRREPQGEPQDWNADVPAVLRRLYAARGVLTPAQIDYRLARLQSPTTLDGLDRAVALLADTIATGGRILVAGDYDADGATGTAVAVRGLRMLGASSVDFVIPNRFAHGYGLSPALVESIAPVPALLLTVDQGVASIAGVAAAQARGMRVIVTDHHLPGEQLPAADAIVNPNVRVADASALEALRLVEKRGQGSPLFDPRTQDARPCEAARMKNLAGVGVVFYLLLALRAHLYPADAASRGDRQVGAHAGHRSKDRPDLSALLDLVALGTVADLVPLDDNNRVLVAAGLRRIRAGKASAGVTALVAVAAREVATLAASDLAFAVAPRLNAAGRLQDMRLGVQCLLADDPATARDAAVQLDAINRERRELQAAMVDEAEALAARACAGIDAPAGVVLHENGWHAGIVGLVASRLKDRLHRPVIAFAPVAPVEECGDGLPLFDSRAQDGRPLVQECGDGLPLFDPREQDVRPAVQECNDGSLLLDSRSQDVRKSTAERVDRSPPSDLRAEDMHPTAQERGDEASLRESRMRGTPTHADTELRGSARSVADFHIRDALALIDARHPGLILRFGGHAMAAGLSLPRDRLAEFAAAFDAVAREWLGDTAGQRVIETDGELPAGGLTLELALMLRNAGPWGQAFPEPVFDNVFECVAHRPVGERHLRMTLRDPRDGARIDAVMFHAPFAVPPSRLRAAYGLMVDTWQGRQSVKLLLHHVDAA